MNICFVFIAELKIKLKVMVAREAKYISKNKCIFIQVCTVIMK